MLDVTENQSAKTKVGSATQNVKDHGDTSRRSE